MYPDYKCIGCWLIPATFSKKRERIGRTNSWLWDPKQAAQWTLVNAFRGKTPVINVCCCFMFVWAWRSDGSRYKQPQGRLKTAQQFMSCHEMLCFFARGKYQLLPTPAMQWNPWTTGFRVSMHKAFKCDTLHSIAPRCDLSNPSVFVST